MVELRRFWMSGERPTLGAFFLDDELICASLELPWKDNQQNISCIPCGEYPVTWDAQRFLFHVADVPDRSGIQIHKGNFVTQIQGCIMPGQALEFWPLIRTLDSGLALQHLRAAAGDEFKLKITCGG